jgi:hypothetical protein
MTSMRTRTSYCPHGFQIPGKPEPWVSLKCKASRFCLNCWTDYGQTFRDHGFTQIEAEDRIQYGFLDIIHFVLRDRAYYRDQDRFEFLEMELRMHLWEKREDIERAMRAEPRKVKNYVRRALNNKLQDIQEGSEFEVERFSESFDDIALDDLPDDIDSLDETPKDPLKTGPTQENAELVRRAIEEQSHRLDALAIVSQDERARQVEQTHVELIKAIVTLPPDEQTAMRLRFLDGNELRKGRPRARADILRELRINGNGGSSWSEWDMRLLEQQAVIRLRSKVTLPAILKDRD